METKQEEEYGVWECEGEGERCKLYGGRRDGNWDSVMSGWAAVVQTAHVAQVSQGAHVVRFFGGLVLFGFAQGT